MKTYEVYSGNGAAQERRDPDRIQHDLHEILSEMSETVEAIQEKFSPGEMLDQALRGLRGLGRGSSDFATNLGRSIRDNPVPAALIGIGVGALMFSGRGRGSPETRGELREKAAGALESAKARTGEAEEKLSERAHELGERAQEAGRRVREAGEHAAERARYRASRARHWLSRIWYDQPLVVGAVCAAIGAAIGASLPATERERELLGPLGQEAKERMGTASRGAIQEAEQAIAPEPEQPPRP
jgi:hypothetical protein